ncbi:MAG: C2 domain-containing protein [Benniella sp.]|nr:MAG: C2 domain-containing protein [Benniella sp.]
MTARQLRTQVNPKICLTIRFGGKLIGAGVPVLVEDVSLKGDVNVRLKLIPTFPHIKFLEFAFIEKPTIDYALKPVGGDTLGMDIAHIPGLQNFIRDTTHWALEGMMYQPHYYRLDLEQMMTGATSLNAAVGVVQFTVYNARDLKNVELVGNSDPYVKIRLGNRPELASTSVQNDTLNPVWNETNIILVSTLEETIFLDVFDKNVPKDRQLGEASFDLKSLLKEPIQDDVWCKVKRNHKERGAVRIRAAYFPIEKPQPTEDGSEPIPVESNSGILTISVPQAKDISQNSRIKSQCRVLFNGREVYQSKNVLGTNPGYWTDVDVFVTDLKAAQVNVELISDGDIIGTYGVSGTKLLENSDKILKNTEDKVEFVSMQGGTGAAKLKITAVWKPILMGDGIDPAAHKPAFGVIRVKIMAARDLRNVEAIGGDSDPYVVIVGAGGVGRGRTKTIDSDLNPEWNEIHYVAVGSMKQFFELEVFDFQKRTKDRPLGETSFKVSEVIEELPNDGGYVALSPVNRWAPLKLKDEFKGELHYEISFFPSLKIAQEATEQENAALPPGTIRASDALDYDSGILAVHLVGAELDRSGTYCEFYVDSDFYQYKSRLQKSRDPKWNEMFDLFVKELDYAKLVIQVKDKSGVEGSSIVGTVTTSIRTLLDSNTAEGVTLPILDKTDERGTIKLKLGFKPVPIDLLPVERLDNMGNLNVTLVRATNLPAADRSGASDPYFVFRANGKEVFKSEVVKKELNPVYNESFVVPINSRVEDELTFEIFDWNQIGTAKSLGTGTVDLRNIQLVLPNEFKIPIQSKYNTGEVQVRLRFMPEFLSSNKHKSGFGATFIAQGGQAVAGGVLDVTGAVGKGALKGVGAVGKGVLGGLSAGATVVGLKKEKTFVSNFETTATGESGTLTIRVIEADGLKGVDRGGMSDPYCKVTVGTKDVLKTKVKKETITPSWNESAVISVDGKPVAINFLVKDYNTIGGSKDLGGCDLSPWDYIQPGSQTKADFWAPLGGTGGRLHIAFEFQPTA